MRKLFEQEYKKHEKSLYLVAAAYLHNTEDAKDVLQEAVLSAYLGFGKLKNKEYFKSWMTRIVINKSKDFLKKRRCTEELTDGLGVFYDIGGEDFEIIDAICRMNPKTSVYISLKFYNEMTYEEMAKTLKIPVSTVKYRTKNALEELEKLLKGDVLN